MKHSSENEAWVARQLNGMSLAEKIGQMIVPALSTEFINAHSTAWGDTLDKVKQLHVSGFIVRGEDLFSHLLTIQTLQEHHRIPLLFCADLEKGLGGIFKSAVKFPPMMALGAIDDTTVTYEIAKAITHESRMLGIPLILGPVVDINSQCDNPVINIRSFGDDPHLVARHSETFINGIHDAGGLATAKHFPGHGATSDDSHLVIPENPANFEQLSGKELIPFKASIRAGVDLIMSSHTWLPNLGMTKKIPATLSKKIMTGLLRDKLNYTGVTITDSMQMKAITANFSLEEAAGLAVSAGNDLVLDMPDPQKAIEGITAFVKDGKILIGQIDASVSRILRLKRKAGLYKNTEIDTKKIHQKIGKQSAWALSKEVDRKSLTLLRNKNHILPLKLSAQPKLLVMDIFPQNSALQMSTISGLLTEKFQKSEYLAMNDNISRFLGTSLMRAASESAVIVWNIFVRPDFKGGKLSLSKNIVTIFNKLHKTQTPILATAFGNPYLFSSVPYVDGYICAYDNGTFLQEAVFAAITGQTAFCGRLPVSISGYFKAGAGL